MDGIGFYDGTYQFVRDSVIQELGIKPNELFLSAIHTHSAPRVGLDEEKRHPNNVAYTRKLASKIVECIRNALANLSPAEIGTSAEDLGHLFRIQVDLDRRNLAVDQVDHLGEFQFKWPPRWA